MCKNLCNSTVVARGMCHVVTHCPPDVVLKFDGLARARPSLNLNRFLGLREIDPIPTPPARLRGFCLQLLSELAGVDAEV